MALEIQLGLKTQKAHYMF